MRPQWRVTRAMEPTKLMIGARVGGVNETSARRWLLIAHSQLRAPTLLAKASLGLRQSGGELPASIPKQFARERRVV